MNLDLFQEIMRDDYGQKMTMYDNSRVFTPEKIAKQMVDMLPDQVWDPKTKFLDPCCKTGVFLIEIYNKLDEVLQKLPDYSDKSKRRNHILNNQIFGIALDDESLVYSRRNVAGDIFYENIQYLPQFMRFIKDKDYAEIKKLLKQEEVFKMDKFDVVIGNPPYQDSNGGGNGSGGNTLYDRFIDIGIDLYSEYVLMITKDSWMQSNKIRKTRDKMLNEGLVNVYRYPNIHEVFQSVSVACSIFLIHKGYSGDTNVKVIESGKIVSEYNGDLKKFNVIPSSYIDLKIIEKMQTEQSFKDFVKPNQPYGIRSNGTSKQELILQSDVKDDIYNIPVLYMDGRSSYWLYIQRQDIPKGLDLIDCYKIVCGQQLNRNGNVITNLKILPNPSICSSSYGILFQQTSKEKIQNCLKYIKQRLLRYLVYTQLEQVQTISPSRFSLVPLQDFTSNSDIDWSKSIEDIDKQLYRKYNLTQEEIDYIEKTIKPMK